MEEIKLKKCKKCGEEKPANKMYFHIHNGCKDGLNTVCKSCRSSIAAKRNRQQKELDNGFKTCVDCGEVLEINENNFRRKINSLDGFLNVCIKCQIKRRRNGAEEGFKKCITCNEIFPLTRDYFQLEENCIDGYRNMCWKCIGRDYHPEFAPESWTDEDIRIVKDNYECKIIKDIIPLLSIKRTEKAVLHMAQKLNIRKITNYIVDYSNLKYKIINNVLHKFCKSCSTYLPNSFDYFSKDEKCTDGLRNVCRKCKGESYKIDSNVHKWTDDEVDIMINYYPYLTNRELIETYFSYLDTDRILHKSYQLRLYKTEETLYRSAQEVGDFHSERLSLLEKWQGEDNPQYDSQRFGELNPNYKGGISVLSQELRRNIKQWKYDSMENADYKCFFTNKRFDNIHHLYSFDNIIRDTLSETGLPLYETISNYSDKELKQLIDKCLEIHYRHPLGICLSEKYHIQFHLEYGYGNNTEEQFYEFIDNYYNGKYKDIEEVS